MKSFHKLSVTFETFKLFNLSVYGCGSLLFIELVRTGETGTHTQNNIDMLLSEVKSVQSKLYVARLYFECRI